jgi:hypothetical protein
VFSRQKTSLGVVREKKATEPFATAKDQAPLLRKETVDARKRPPLLNDDEIEATLNEYSMSYSQKQHMKVAPKITVSLPVVAEPVQEVQV